MSNIIDQQIANLENQKKELEKQKIEDKKFEGFNNLKQNYEGKVKCSISKRKTGINISATWYKQVIMETDGIYVPRESVTVSIDYQYKRYNVSTEIIDKKHYNCKISNIEDRDFTSHKKELTIENFELLKNNSISFMEAISLLGQGKDFLKTSLTMGEDVVEKSIESTVLFLDIPYIMLNQHEAWLLGTSVFLNDLCFLLTPASMNFARQKINEQIKRESNSGRLLASYGYRHRNDRTEGLQSLLVKLEEKFYEIK